MIVLSARGLTRQFDAAPIVNNATFDIRAGEKVGLVGPNGAGKSTLVKILVGIDGPDKGSVEIPNRSRVAMLEQQVDGGKDTPLVDEVKRGMAPLYALQERSEELAHLMAEPGADLDKLHDEFDHVQNELLRLDAYNIDHRVEEVLDGLQFDRDSWQRPLKEFSGGQQNRAALARLLLEAPDLLILDEPTNHLDIETTEWLESYLQKSTQAVLVISHDRYFLDNTTSRTLELVGGVVTDYPGNFSKYWTLREERVELLRRAHEKQTETIAKTQDFIRKNMAGQKTKQAQSRQKALEKVQRVELPPDFVEMPMGFRDHNGQGPDRTGDMVVEATDVAGGYDAHSPLFEDVTTRVERGDRVGVFGPNGVGKTTLLKTLLGELPKLSGTIRLGSGVKVGYHDQKLTSVDPKTDAVEAVRPPDDPTGKPGPLRSLLARFGISGDLALCPVGAMSGGERTRVALARLAALRANVLVLDEPTNHLDFWSCAALERSLREFEGTVLIVTHDRYFLDRVATRVLELKPDSWQEFDGNYSEYHDWVERRAEEPAPSQKTAAKKAAAKKALKTQQPAAEPSKPKRDRKPKRKRKFPYKPTEALEAEIETLESQIADFERLLVDPDVHKDAAKMRDLQSDYAYAQDELARVMEHWEEAAELN